MWQEEEGGLWGCEEDCEEEPGCNCFHSSRADLGCFSVQPERPELDSVQHSRHWGTVGVTLDFANDSALSPEPPSLQEVRCSGVLHNLCSTDGH